MTITRPRRAVRRPLTGTATALAFALSLAACGDSEDAASTTPAPTAAPASSAASSTAASASTAAPVPEPAQVDVTLTEFAVEMPSEIPSGFVRVSATNTGTIVHHLILGRIHDDTTYETLIETFARDPFAAEGMIDFYGGPNGINPGDTVSTELNLTPGNYIALCVIPLADGTPHAAMGMFAPLTVTDDGEAVDLAAMEVEATISMTDYDFTVSPGFDGQGRVLVTNDGSQAHEVAVTPIGEGGSFEEFKTVMMSDPSTLEPTVASRYEKGGGGLTPIAPGQSAIVEFNLAAGDYVFICFVTDTGDQLPHFLHDMMKLVHIPT